MPTSEAGCLISPGVPRMTDLTMHSVCYRLFFVCMCSIYAFSFFPIWYTDQSKLTPPFLYPVHTSSNHCLPTTPGLNFPLSLCPQFEILEGATQVLVTFIQPRAKRAHTKRLRGVSSLSSSSTSSSTVLQRTCQSRRPYSRGGGVPRRSRPRRTTEVSSSFVFVHFVLFVLFACDES